MLRESRKNLPWTELEITGSTVLAEYIFLRLSAKYVLFFAKLMQIYLALPNFTKFTFFLKQFFLFT